MVEPIPDESKPGGLTTERVELHQLSNDGPGRVTEDLQSDPESFRQGNVLILIGLGDKARFQVKFERLSIRSRQRSRERMNTPPTRNPPFST